MSDIKNLGESFLKSRLGDDLCSILEDENIEEIMLNADGSVFIEARGCGMHKAMSLDALRSQSIIRTMATFFNTEINAQNAIVSGHMPFYNARFEGVLPPLVKAPCFSIRKHGSLSLSIEMLKDNGMLTDRQLEILCKALSDRRSVIICGETSSGKTTLVNAMLNELLTIAPYDRLLLLEDTPELTLSCDNHICLYANDASDMSALVRQALRLRPDRIIVGEVRGAEALDLIDALSTGHSGGLCTLHAGSIEQALMRLVLLISRHKSAPRLIEPFLTQALDLIVILKTRPVRHIADIACVTGYDNGRFIYHSIV
ncbi:Type IV secretion system protein virB11 [Anaerobiospirillum thomasii]|uniref:ATPase, T2SS/T4P/T4SS family n=1 Tax=Anaerobiospirillum thomasii TaxID=179995 RepID=UPI000D9A006E|nr:ATPase, T2SS/T4P/T4SS family [Anaerobiospirillum thomasii]SPT71582.1 Type IV secretion system protein virB11 [Anaerobiospirillum thomasii]